ncbi:MAG: hypothetical protein KGZ96_12060 [Clostridia bacterium]|jgi:phage FluMu protein Com|nr:hypothetical protein [Clostridia bacterium]
MNQFRCQCKKIVCQIEGDVIIIKCRHCKRYLHIVTEGIKEIQFKLSDKVEQVAATNDKWD